MSLMGKTTNILIPSLISLFNEYNNNLRTRLKADTLFLSFDERSKKTFNKFINLSNDRFKLMKYGGQLNHIILNQKQNYSKLHKDIENDLLFNTNYSTVERKKLIKSVNEFKSKEISKVRDKLFETLKQRTAIDIMLREKQILARKEKAQNNNFLKRFSSTSKLMHISSLENEKNKFYDNRIDFIEKHFRDTIADDQKNFMNGMETYKNLLKTKKNGFYNNNEFKNMNNNKYVKISKNEFSDIESHLNENNIKVLSYNEDISNNSNKKKNEDEKFDINCLYKIKNNNNFNSKHPDDKFKLFPKLKLNTESSTNLTINNNFRENSLNYKTFSNHEVKNTIKLIKKEAFNGVMLGEKFQSQKERFDTYYNRHFPNFAHKPEKNTQFRKIKEDIKRRKTMRKTVRKTKINKKRKLSNYEQIFEDFQKIYNDKKEIWKKEDNEKEIMRKNEEKKEKDIINFLLNLEERKKKK